MKLKQLNEMALPRKKMLAKLESYSDVILEHIIKTVIYKDSTNNLHKWVYVDIATKLKMLNCIPCQANIKYDDYLDHLFYINGNEVADIYPSIGAFQFKHTPEYTSMPISSEFGIYPNFELTDKLVLDVFNVFNNFAILCSQEMAEHNKDLDSQYFGDLYMKVYNEVI